MHKTNFDWHCIFYGESVFIFYHDDCNLVKQYFINPCLFHWGFKLWGYIIFHWSHDSFSIRAINHAFSTEAMFKHWTWCKFLCLEATTERCSLKYVFFKTRESRHTRERYEYIAMTGKINIIIFVIWNCCSSHVLKRFYQADFNVFGL